MTNVSHASLTGADLHEPKGIATVPSGQIYVSNGSGSGTWQDAGSVISNSSWSTGDAKLTYVQTAPSGWILVNDGTIGDGSSGGTTRANADTAALFTLLWGLPFSLTVSGGRGVSASADYAAHKTIQVPLFLGRALGIAGAGAGLTSRTLGSSVGAETVTLAQANLPNVTLSVSGTASVTATSTYISSLGNVAAQSGSGVVVFNAVAGQSAPVSTGTITGTTASINGNVTQTATSIYQPTTFVNLLIKL